MSDEKYITDGAYGVTQKNANKGYDDALEKAPDPYNTWAEENEQARAYSNIGFGRGRGEDR